MTGEEIKEYVHSQAELPFLERDNRGKGYICPCCGNGSGSSGDGIVKVPLSSSYKCFKCGESGDAFSGWVRRRALRALRLSWKRLHGFTV